MAGDRCAITKWKNGMSQRAIDHVTTMWPRTLPLGGFFNTSIGHIIVDIVDNLMIDRDMVGELANRKVVEFNAEIESYKKEIACLRSVLSEWDQDKSCYTMYNVAEQLRKERASGKI